MTIIAVTHGLVLADKRRNVPSNLADILKLNKLEDKPKGKIHAYDKGAKVHSRQHKFADTFFGYGGTGPEEIIELAGNSLAVLESFDLWLAGYIRIDELRFLNDMTGFSIAFFGLEGTLEVNVHSGDIRVMYHPHIDTAHLALGSGNTAFKKLRDTIGAHSCPVKLVHGVFAMEPSCGGGLEVWTLPTALRGSGARMHQLYNTNGLTLEDYFRMMADPYKQLFPKETATWLAALIQRSLKSSKQPSVDAPSTHSQLAQVLLGKNWKRTSPELKSLICT